MLTKAEFLKLKLEIYQTVYDGIVLDPKYIDEEMIKTRAQLEILEEEK